MYDFLVSLGKASGCHRMPERSFFIKGKQFPVCARCTGVFFGYIFGFALCFFVRINIFVCIAFLGVMFADWLIQYIGILESDNIRRLMSGILCGIGMIHIYYNIAYYLIFLIFR